MDTIFQTDMIYSSYTACRDPKYVEDPTSFKPERWARDSPTNEELDALLSLPFGFGPRSCYGDVHIEFHFSLHCGLLLFIILFL